MKIKNLKKFLTLGIVTALAATFLIGCDQSTENQISAAEVLQVREGDWIVGPEDAKVTIVEYSDFQCPACQAAHPVLKQTIEAFPNDVRLVYRHYPLSQHIKALPAHKAAEAAGKQGKFWEMHDLLFERQTIWVNSQNPAAEFDKYAEELGLNMKQFQDDRQSRATRKRIEKDTKDDKNIKIPGTPSIYINGTKMPLQQFEDFKNTIEKFISGELPGETTENKAPATNQPL